MKILAIERDVPGSAADAFGPLLRSEAERVWQLYLDGLVREAYFRADDHCAVLMLEAASREEATAALASLPLVRAGLIAFEVSVLQPYDGFGRLFAAEGDQVEQLAW